MAIRVFISYSHDSPDHMDRVWDLSERLRSNGIDCRIDQHEAAPEEGWPNWCKKQIKDAGFVLVACTETYLRRYDNQEEVGTGRGVKWEGFVITQELYESEGKNKKFIPVVFAVEDRERIPIELRAYTNYDLSGDAGYEGLFRRLTDQPERTAIPIAGAVRVMPTRPGKPEEKKAAPGTTSSPLPALPAIERKLDFSAAKWNVPIPQNPFFTGREEALKRVEQNLAAAGTAALSGLGGMGKSQVAAQYAYTHRGEYGAVLWANADTSETLTSALAGMAGVLGLPESEAREQDAAVNATLQWLDSNDGWLLVLDNANHLPVIRDIVPKAKANKHHIIVTTQAQAVGALKGIPLDVMPLPDATKLLLRRAKLMDGDVVPEGFDPKQGAGAGSPKCGSYVRTWQLFIAPSIAMRRLNRWKRAPKRFGRSRVRSSLG